LIGAREKAFIAGKKAKRGNDSTEGGLLDGEGKVYGVHSVSIARKEGYSQKEDRGERRLGEKRRLFRRRRGGENKRV